MCPTLSRGFSLKRGLSRQDAQVLPYCVDNMSLRGEQDRVLKDMYNASDATNIPWV